MKQFYLTNFALIIGFFAITSCSPKYRFVTKGLKDSDSSYLVKANGEHVNAIKIVVREAKVTVDGQKINPSDLTAIKSKKMYFSVNNSSVYPVEIYGKVNLLYKLTYIYTHSSSSSMSGASGSSVIKGYYLQKQGDPNMVSLTRSSFLEYMADNPEAQKLAKAHYIWQYTSWLSFAGYLGGTIYTVSAISNNKSLGTPLAIVGGSFITHIVLTSIANHKLKKALLVYNGIDQ